MFQPLFPYLNARRHFPAGVVFIGPIVYGTRRLGFYVFLVAKRRSL